MDDIEREYRIRKLKRIKRKLMSKNADSGKIYKVKKAIKMLLENKDERS